MNPHAGEEMLSIQQVVCYDLYRARPEPGADADDSITTTEQLLARCRELTAPAVRGYIWHRQRFTLRAGAGSGLGSGSGSEQAAGGGGPDSDPSAVVAAGAVGEHYLQLSGRVEFGDNVEDEWFIVWLLTHITRSIPNTVASVRDDDGQFLLIEAADHIPRWLSPDNADNRVFVAAGRLHIVPIPQSPADIGVYPTGELGREAALDTVLNDAAPTAAAESVQACLAARLDAYPAHALQSVHGARCYLPRQAVAVLDCKPQLVADAVAAFYERDLLDMKACLTMKRFPPADRTMARVKLSRCLYAQLTQQRFLPGKLFGRRPAPSSPDYKAHDLGAKLAVGFEILAARGAKLAARGGSASGAAPSGRAWDGFLRSLEAKGYFAENIEGSREHTRLRHEAGLHFAAMAEKDPKSAVVDPADEAALRLEAALRAATTGPESEWPGTSAMGPAAVDDDDSWLDMSLADLDRMLAGRLGGAAAAAAAAASAQPAQGTAPESDVGDGAAQDNLSKMVGTMSQFFGAVSTHEGAEVDGQGIAELDELSDSDLDDTSDDGSDAGDAAAAAAAGAPVSFDPGSFMQTLQQLIGCVDGDGLTGLVHGLADPAGAGGVSAPKARSLSPLGAAPAAASAASSPTVDASAAPRPPAPAPARHDEASIAELAGMMDEELRGTALSQSFAQPDYAGDAASGRDSAPEADGDPAAAEGGDEGKDGKAPVTPLDLDLNLVKNVLDSYSAQQGMAGPVSNLLGSLGLALPDNADGSGAVD